MDYVRDHDDTQSAASFPLPFRVLFLICLGILGWATNLHGLHNLGLDAAGALDLRVHDTISVTRLTLPTNRSPGSKYLSHPSSSYIPVYRLFAFCSIWCFTLWCVYRYATHQNVLLVDIFKYLPAVAALGLLITLFCPFNVLESPHRDALLL
jgi:EXS family